MTTMFNTPVETALRLLLLFETESRYDFTANMVAAVDFAALYGKSFGLSDVNLHGDNLFKFSEFAARQALAKEGINLLVRRGLVDVNSSEKGFTFHISSAGRELAAELEMPYADDYRKEVRKALKRYEGMTEQAIVRNINRIAAESLAQEERTFHEQ